MDFPSGGVKSGILEKVQAFLPMIEKANLELADKIAKEGSDSVRIDKSLDSGAESTTSNNGGTNCGGNGKSIHSNKSGNSQSKKPMIVEINSKEEKEQEQFEQDGLEDSQTGSREEIDPEVSDEDCGGLHGDKDTKRMIQMEFALGDFDNTPIAQAEREAEERRSPPKKKSRKGGEAILYKEKAVDEDEEE